MWSATAATNTIERRCSTPQSGAASPSERCYGPSAGSALGCLRVGETPLSGPCLFPCPRVCPNVPSVRPGSPWRCPWLSWYLRVSGSVCLSWHLRVCGSVCLSWCLWGPVSVSVSVLVSPRPRVSVSVASSTARYPCSRNWELALRTARRRLQGGGADLSSLLVENYGHLRLAVAGPDSQWVDCYQGPGQRRRETKSRLGSAWLAPATVFRSHSG